MISEKKALQAVNAWRKPAAVIIFFTAIAVLFLPRIPAGDATAFSLLLGRLHPLILHFPIVLIVMALAFEVVTRRYRWENGALMVLVILMLAALSAVVSIGAGYLLFSSGDYSGSLIDSHFQAGAIAGALILFTTATYLVFLQYRRLYPLYLAALLASNIAVGWASHLGGSVTHGPAYLSEHLPFVFSAMPERTIKSETDMRVFGDVLLPVFEGKCMSCHNDVRAKGGFVMSTLDGIRSGGDSGKPAIASDHPAESELIRRVILPEDDADRMPPEGKMPMTQREIDLMVYWIGSGASDTLTVAAARRVDSVNALLDTLLPELQRYHRMRDIQKMKEARRNAALTSLAQGLDVHIAPDTLDDSNLQVLAMKFPPAPFDLHGFQELRPWFAAFSRVSLAGSDIDDASLYYLGQMQNVRALFLQKTRIDGSGLIYLRNLPRLEVLNLSFTTVDDRAVLELLTFPALREVYLYRTNTSPQVIEALRKYKPQVRFLLEEGPYL